MTRLGQILIFINVALSIAMAGLALGLYSNRIEWAGAKPNESEGEIAKLNVEIKAQQNLFNSAVLRWSKEKSDLEKQEALQARAREFYAKQLDLLVKGKGPGQPVDVLVYNNGQLQIGADGLPTLQRSRDAQMLGREPQEQELRTVENSIRTEIQETEKIMNEEARLTSELNGKQQNPRGLRDLLRDMLTAEKKAGEELLYVKRERINGKEAATSVLNRQRQLKEREEQLKKQKIALQAQ